MAAIHCSGRSLADLDGTLALGVVTMGLVYVSSVRESGWIPKDILRALLRGEPAQKSVLFPVFGILVDMITDADARYQPVAPTFPEHFHRRDYSRGVRLARPRAGAGDSHAVLFSGPV
jgi:hypothetical protein